MPASFNSDLKYFIKIKYKYLKDKKKTVNDHMKIPVSEETYFELIEQKNEDTFLKRIDMLRKFIKRGVKPLASAMGI